MSRDKESLVFLDGKWWSNSVYYAIKEGWSRTRVVNAAIRAGEEVDIPETIRQTKDDPRVYLVLQSGEVFRGGYDKYGEISFSRFNPIEYACMGILPGLQL